MDTSFDYGISDSIIENNKCAYNDTFYIEDEILNKNYPINNFLFQNNQGNNQKGILIKDNSNPFNFYTNKENDSFNEDIPNQEQIYFFSFSNNHNNKVITNINKETNLIDLKADQSKVKQIFEIKKDYLPKLFTESSINLIIRQYDISKELKLKLLLNINIKNNDIVQIKRVLESNTKKRRKTCENNLYRTDHILIKLINIIDSSLINFINNLIICLYPKEKIYHILDGIISLNHIDEQDLKMVIKKNAYIFRGKLETIEEKLNLLNLSLKKYFSVKISPIYDKSKYPSNYNELIIEKLLNEKDNRDIFDFILNDLLIKDWLEIILYKKDLKDFDKYYSFDKTKKNKIKENIERIDKYINKIYKKGEIYLQCFIFIAYNLYRFLIIKEKRKKTKTGNEGEKIENLGLKSLVENQKIEN